MMHRGSVSDRSILERLQRYRHIRLLVCATVATFVAAIIAVCVLHFHRPAETTSTEVDASADIQSAINTAVSPCADFYEYACGNWKGVSKGQKVAESVEDLVVQNNRLVMRELLESSADAERTLASSSTGRGLLQKMKAFYASCIDEAEVAKLEAEPLRRYLDSVARDFGDRDAMSTLTASPGTKSLSETLIQALVKVHLRNIAPFFTPFIRSVEDEANMHEVRFEAALPRTVRDAQEYRREVEEAFRVLFPAQGSDTPDWQEVSEKVLAFQLQLNAIADSTKEEASSAVHYDPNNHDSMAVFSLPYLSLVKFVEEALHATHTHTSLGDLKAQVKIIRPDYFTRLNTLLESTDARVVKLYILWEVVQNDVQIMSHLARWSRSSLDLLPTQERWQHCVDQVDQAMPFATLRWFIKQHFSDNDQAQAVELFDNIKEELIQYLDSRADWMSDESRHSARRRIERMRDSVGSPRFAADFDKVARLYENLTFDRSRYLDNLLVADKHFGSLQWRQLENASDRSISGRFGMLAGMRYDRGTNEMHATAYWLQPPFFSAKMPSYLNYGGAGHAMGSAISSVLRPEDPHPAAGQARQPTANFTTHALCYAQQRNVTTGHSIGNIIADHAGVRLSLNAWHNQRRDSQTADDRSPVIPGRTPEQLFFISAVHRRCVNPASAHSAEQRAHSKSTANSLLQNFQEFATAFQCSRGEPMNPEHKCQMW
ncbi:Endothelin-converting enzyme 1 [Sorochytrium milnesiophthora]